MSLLVQRTSHLVRVALASIGLTVAGVGAQEDGPETTVATIAERVNVNVVNIDVHVTDRKGRPISDLTIDDFEVFEEGEPMEITNFLNAASRDDREWLEGVAGPEAIDGVDPPLMVVLYIDRGRTRQAHLQRIRRDLAAFLSARRDRGDGIRFLLASGDPELNVRVPFTTDPGELTKALEDLHADRKSLDQSLSRDDELFRLRIQRQIKEDYQSCDESPFCEPCEEGWGDLLTAASYYAQEMRSRAMVSLSVLAELVTGLGAVPGPKALIYVSDGLPQRPGAEMYDYLGRICLERQSETGMRALEWDQTAMFNRFSSLSNASRVTLYPVDAGGVRASSSVDVTTDPTYRSDYRLSNVFVPSNQNDRLRIDNLQTTLHLLADETGGRAVFNQPHPAKALEDIAEDFGSYYSLGYSAPPNRRHPIRQVDVRLTAPRKGWRVRYRRSYIMKSEERRLADRLYAALRLNEQSNALNVDVTFGKLAAAAASRVTVPVEVRVPFSEIALLPGPGGSAGAVRIFLVASDADGERTPMRQKTLTITEAQHAAGQARGLVVVNVDLPWGDYQVAVGVRDEASGRASYLVKGITVP